MKKEIKYLTVLVTTMATFGVSSLFADSGKLSLVSSGTGDLENMTVKAHKTIKSADIVFTMNGQAGKFAPLIKDKPIYPAGHALFSNRVKGKWMKVKDESGKTIKKTSQEIEKIEQKYKSMIRQAIKNDKNVVIIDNGDPTIYGPHLNFLKEFQDLNPKIIPGLSSFNAANAALQTSVIGGIKDARGLTLTIGNTNNQLIEKLAETGSTMVFFMDRKFSDFMKHLRTLYPVDTPIAIVIEAGSAKNEKVMISTLENIEKTVGKQKIPFNHLVYVGNFLK